MKIKIINACLAAGEHRDPGRMLAVGADISKEEAEKLVRMGRAIETAEAVVAEKSAEKKSGKNK